MSDFEHQENLRAARQNSPSKMVSNVKDLAKRNPLKLVSQVSIFRDMPYAVAFGAAILKDMLDLAVIGALPGIGTVLTIMASITIFFMMLLSGGGKHKKAAGGMIKKGLALLGGTTFEMIGFGLNFFPIQTATVLVVYFMELSERKKAAEEEETQASQNNLVSFPARPRQEKAEDDKSMQRAA